MRNVVIRTWDELATEPSGTRRVATPSSAVLAELLSDSASAWWDDRSTPQVETRDDILAASLAAALQTTRKRYGDPKSDNWRWDHIRFENANHLLRLPALSALNLPVQGGTGTLSPSSGAGTHGSSWRMVVELGTGAASVGDVSGRTIGQSGERALSRSHSAVGQRRARARAPSAHARRARPHAAVGGAHSAATQMTRIIFHLLVAGSMAGLTWLLGWWGVAGGGVDSRIRFSKRRRPRMARRTRRQRRVGDPAHHRHARRSVGARRDDARRCDEHSRAGTAARDAALSRADRVEWSNGGGTVIPHE